MDRLAALLYSLSNAFLIPTLAGVLALFVMTTYLVGQCLSEALDRRTNRASLAQLESARGDLAVFLRSDWRGGFGRVSELLRKQRVESHLIDKAVADLENEARARLERLSILTRTGPILGLIGTLIPLQPALAGLAQGDMQQMAANLLVGFTTTVIGLLVGGTAFVIAVLVRIWAREDLTEMRFLIEHWRERWEPAEEQAYAQEVYVAD